MYIPNVYQCNPMYNPNVYTLIIHWGHTLECFYIHWGYTLDHIFSDFYIHWVTLYTLGDMMVNVIQYIFMLSNVYVGTTKQPTVYTFGHIIYIEQHEYTLGIYISVFR